jgi:hypothetical protein
MSEERTPATLWEEMAKTFEELERDFKKNSEKHNVSAGIRVRKGVRTLRKLAAEFLRLTIEVDKETKEARKAEKAKKSEDAPKAE